MTGDIHHFHRCLLPFLPAWEAVGWRECARTWIQSCFEWSVLIEWHGSGDPVVLETL